ncbi:binding-protein-dependent transport system membrane protein [Bordetella ansorpii]|uniref:Binding-protein-dependent transport system membrane protein n=1 Tax=Bordetella ansorpii TaxID=288768 RepID=A0A157P0Y4_9BORD|nr:ABC transporter permease [Bordetella ansorpii]SAI26649.1 binding-protein-dependent transport system membrane protein [Bordetella ansorpii]
MNTDQLTGSGGKVVYALCTLILAFIVLPLAIVVALSISEASFAVFPPKGFTFGWFQSVLGNGEFRHAFMTSVALALAATASAILMGLPAAYALSRWKVPFASMIESLLLSPMMLPVLITGVALLQFFSTMQMYDSAVNLFIGHLMITLPYMVRTVSASLKQVNRSLEDAALTLGASPARVFLFVTLPQVVPGVAAGALFAFMISFDDFPISMWLADSATVPLPIYLHHSMSKVFDPSISAMSTLMIVTGVVAVLALERMVGLRKAMGV